LNISIEYKMNLCAAQHMCCQGAQHTAIQQHPRTYKPADTRNCSLEFGWFFDDDCFYYHSWRNNVVIAFGTLSPLHCTLETRWHRFGQFLNNVPRNCILDFRDFMLDFTKIVSENQLKIALFV